MIARVGRLAGAILAECNGSYFLVGNTKEPCDWNGQGFQTPAELDARANPVLPLALISDRAPSISLGLPQLLVTLKPQQQGEDVARVLAHRFLIVRNGSVSDRLWNLIVGEDSDVEVEATWLLDMPEHVWQVVRDTVLRCT